MMNLRSSDPKFLSVATVFFVVLLFMGCNGVTVKSRTQDADFVAANKPVRTLKIAVITEDAPDRKSITDWIKKCSTYSVEQVGIELRPSLFVQASLPSVSSRSERLTAMHNILKNYQDWDIAINPASYTAGDVLKTASFLPFPVVHGYVDDTYRRYIVLKRRACWAFLHEFFHTLVLSHVHSHSGVMQGSHLQLLPFAPPINRTEYLSPQDRMEVLENKWRNFNDKADVEGSDRITEN